MWRLLASLTGAGFLVMLSSALASGLFDQAGAVPRQQATNTPTASASPTDTPVFTSTATPSPTVQVVLEFEGKLTRKIEGCLGLEDDAGAVVVWPLAASPNVLAFAVGDRVRISGYWEPFTGGDICQAGRYFIVLTIESSPIAAVSPPANQLPGTGGSFASEARDSGADERSIFAAVIVGLLAMCGAFAYWKRMRAVRF